MEGRLKPRQQGDLGELSAMVWLTEKGANVFKPVFHSPDVDLVADLGDRLISVEVKTCDSIQNGRWRVQICTRGGNQSWSGLVKYFDPGRCDYLFVHVGDGRRWFIPTERLECRWALTLGGPKYAEFEIERSWPLRTPPIESALAKGEYRSGQPGRPVKALAMPSQVRILPPPLTRTAPLFDDAVALGHTKDPNESPATRRPRRRP
jgi:hypothetical protein